MSSIFDKYFLREKVTLREIESLNGVQKPYAYCLLYSELPLDKYNTNVKITNVNLDHFKDSPVFTEYVIFCREIKDLQSDLLRDFIENYKASWMSEEKRSAMLFQKCNVIKSPLSIYFSELYKLDTLYCFPKCLKTIAYYADSLSTRARIESDTLTPYEKDAIVCGRFLVSYDTFAHKVSKGQCYKGRKILANSLYEIISMCGYSEDLTIFKNCLLIKYYAMTGNYENSMNLQLEYFYKYKSILSLMDLIIGLHKLQKYQHLEHLLLSYPEFFYEIANSNRSELVAIPLNVSAKHFNNDAKFIAGLIFGNQIRKLLMKQIKNEVYYSSFSISSQCLICCVTTDNILKCVSCNNTTCCVKCLPRIDTKKCMLCRFTF
jgi:hypothetical protein